MSHLTVTLPEVLKMLSLAIVLKDYSQPISIETLIALNPQCFHANKQLKLDLQKPVGIYVDAIVTARMTELEPEDKEMSYPLRWVIDELHKLGLPKDNILECSCARYIWDGDAHGNEVSLSIYLANTDY
ncbi:hypothetical protein [Vibrio parahaemolyticus]|uniref:hypothetical protein n=1 Tax=Vibrio parahaemolyticus TaxID=670 RepID=UPI002B21FC37|nr:hypothetical protein [Vibrio parahaemolyticus]MEA5240874.1 hypothetical protein [Vibrio parahaemolyticus]